MSVAVVIVFVVIAMAVIAILIGGMKAFGQSAERSAARTSLPPKRVEPLVTDFHVNGDTAKALFSVPLGDGPPGEHLTDLLGSRAIEYVRRRTADGLPLDGLRHIEVSAMRGDSAEVVCTVDLPEVGVLPDAVESVLVEPSHDPIAAVAAVVADSSVVAQTQSTQALTPVASFVVLSGPTEAHLRSIGVDPETMSLEELVIGLLRVGGYQVSDGKEGFSLGADETAAIFSLQRSGQTTVLAILEHVDGTHPELEEKVLSRFAVGVAQTNPDVAILVTDKYSPYAMYAREKRDKRLVFITRERLQAFVDSFGIS